MHKHLRVMAQMTEAPFDLEPVVAAMPMKYDIAPAPDHDERARRYYAESPALTPFSRVPVSFDVARSFGINSWARADKRALGDMNGDNE